MTGNEPRSSVKQSQSHGENAVAQGFLPDLCSAHSVISLILVGELLSLALVLASDGIAGFDWAQFGMVCMLVQWILLSSAATLCGLRPWLNRLRGAQAVSVSYAIVLVYTGLFSMIALQFYPRVEASQLDRLVTNLMIAAIFAGVLFRYLYLQQRLKYQEQAELGARVQALQSRIRPHFLFNSLNSIASLIQIKPEQAETMVVNLAQLFRASLQLPQLIPIEKELEHCKAFVSIEQVRLAERLRVKWHIEALPEGTQILNLLLQPLIENAIYHGIQPMPKGGCVDVEVKENKGDIVLRIINPRLPGSEAPPGTHHLSTQVQQVESNGIALSNIRRRLEALYGKRAYLRVVKGESEFTVVVRYPVTPVGKR